MRMVEKIFEVDLDKYVTPYAHVIMGRERAQEIIAAEKLNEFRFNSHTVVFKVPSRLFVIMPTCFQELMDFLPPNLNRDYFGLVCRFNFDDMGLNARESKQWQNRAFDEYQTQKNPTFLS
jgi:hypothetical protein